MHERARMYARIVLPLDGSGLAERVLPYAKALAKGLSVRLDLIRVHQPPPNEWAESAHGVYPHRLSDSLKTTAQDYLEGIASSFREEGLSVLCKVREGNPAQCIAAEAVSESNTLVAMSSHGRSGVSRWTLGSITDKVLHDIEAPLLIVCAREAAADSAPGAVANLIVPQDGSPLAEAALSHVAALGRSLGAKVHLVRACPSLGEYHKFVELFRPGNSTDLHSETYHEFAKEADARAMEHLLEVKDRLSRMGVSSVEVNLLNGPAAEVIVDLAEKTPNCMVVMSSHGRSGLGRWALGSVSDRVVRHSGTPVLVIRDSAEGVQAADREEA